MPPCLFADRDHAAVDVKRNASDHVFGWLTQTILRPVLPDHFEIATDPARGDDHRRCVELEFSNLFPVGLAAALGGVVGQNLTRHAFGGTVLHDDVADLMAELQLDQTGADMIFEAANEMFQNAGPCAPGDMKPWDRVAMPIG